MALVDASLWGEFFGFVAADDSGCVWQAAPEV